MSEVKKKQKYTYTINTSGITSPGKAPVFDLDSASGTTVNGDEAIKNQGTGVPAASVPTTEPEVKVPDGYVDYVSDGEPTPGATGAVGNTGDKQEAIGDTSTEEDFDKVISENKKLSDIDIREGALSYEDWLESAGVDTERDYNAAAKAAAQEYDRSVAGYGANAEAMAQAGLSGSGYSDYLTGNAYAVRQRSMDAARQTKTLADQSAKQSYADYLQGYEDTQRNNITAAIGQLSSMGLKGDNAKKYLESMGIPNGYADWITGVVDEMSVETPDKQALLSNLLSNGMTGDVAMSYAKFLGFDDDTAKSVIDVSDKIITSMKEQAAAEQAATDAEELAGITVDVGSEEIYQLRSLLSMMDDTNWSAATLGLGGIIGGTASMVPTKALEMFPEAQRQTIASTLQGINDSSKRVEYILTQIAEHYAMEGYTEKQIQKILSLIEGGQ